MAGQDSVGPYENLSTAGGARSPALPNHIRQAGALPRPLTLEALLKNVSMEKDTDVHVFSRRLE